MRVLQKSDGAALTARRIAPKELASMSSHSTTRPGPKPKPFWSYVNFNGPPWQDSRCWIWTGGHHGRGPQYGTIKWNGKQGPAHRRAYELARGPIPEGLVIDHLCRTTLCMNPFHMEPVTHRVNILRGEGHTAINARKTHCKRGHLFDQVNIFNPRQGGRECRICRRNYHNAWRKAWRKKQREEKADGW